jgi:carbonic anhydrase
MGHSQCGGAHGFHEMCHGRAPELASDTSFVGRWMDILRPGFDRLGGVEATIDAKALEQEGVKLSLENLMGFPFVRDAVEDGTLSLHGVWHDIGEGDLEYYDAGTGAFQPV